MFYQCLWFFLLLLFSSFSSISSRSSPLQRNGTMWSTLNFLLCVWIVVWKIWKSWQTRVVICNIESLSSTSVTMWTAIAIVPSIRFQTCRSWTSSTPGISSRHYFNLYISRDSGAPPTSSWMHSSAREIVPRMMNMLRIAV